MQTNSKHQQQVLELADAIQSMEQDLERLAKPFRQVPATGKEPAFDKWSPDCWRRNTFGNALIRLHQLTKNNFQFIETMGVLVVARYVFELSVWFLLFQKDDRYCLIYYRELMETQHRHWEDTAAHLRREVELLRRLEETDRNADDDVHRAYKQGLIPATGLADEMKKAMEYADAEGARNFSIYLEDAKTNGYGFQAHLVETKALPRAEQAIKGIAQEIAEFQRRVPKDVQKLADVRWQWGRMAKEVGLRHEYDFIYASASKLLHATPASLTTDHKNLEPAEACVYLRYIRFKIIEMMKLARSQPECQEPAPPSPQSGR